VKGKILGSRYQVLEYIAEGGFGRTYLAEDTQLPGKDLCIVKQLAPSFNAPKLLEIARRLFKSEATALHSLGHHPQIPKLLAYFEEEEKFYLVQQYIAGQTLDKEIGPAQVWSTAQVIELLKDCLNILRFIHERGVIHRDLKPANLIRRNSDRKIVLVDFGTVKNILQGQSSIAELTVSVGTQGYMPIEQARGKPRASSDLYALGMICIQAITGVKPLDLEEDENGEILWSHLVDTKPELIKILTKMTRYNYMDRYRSAQSVLEVLNSCFPSQVRRAVPAIAMNQAALKPSLAENQRQFGLKTGEDPNALPGVRSIAMVANRSSQLVKPKQAKLGLWKIALMVIVIAGGVYLALQLLIKPAPDNSPAEVKTNATLNQK
jgi:serine/threonine protein kinase